MATKRRSRPMGCDAPASSGFTRVVGRDPGKDEDAKNTVGAPDPESVIPIRTHLVRTEPEKARKRQLAWAKARASDGSGSKDLNL